MSNFMPSGKISPFMPYAKEIIKRYNQGFSQEDIKQQYPNIKGNISTILKKYNIQTHPYRRSKLYPHRNQIIQEYNQGNNLSKLANKYNVSFSCMQRLISKYGNPRNNHQHLRKYFPDETKFSSITTPTDAYWLGWMYADGNVYKKSKCESYVINLKVSQKDQDILYKFCDYLSLPYTCIKINNYDTHHPKVYMCIFSKKIFNNLVKYGCMPNKTFKLKPPNFLSDDLILPFIKGFWEGDGGCSVDKNGVFYWYVCCACEEIIKWLKKYIQDNIIYFKGKLYFSKSNVYSIATSHTKACVILEKFYKLNTPSLDRKLNIYQNYIKKES